MIVDPRLNEQSPLRRHPQYAENGCARAGNALYVRALWLPGLLFVAIVVAAVLGSLGAALIAAMFFVFFSLLGALTLVTRVPLGIRMDEDGIRIGGVQAAEEGRSRVHRRDKPIQGFTRAMHVYSCDWEDVRAIRVLTDPQELAIMARGANSGNDHLGEYWWGYLGLAPWAPGRFIAPRAKGALVFEVERERASFQATRPPRGKNADRIYGHRWMTWCIPTNDPMAIKAALAAAQPPVHEDVTVMPRTAPPPSV